ncbi:MAG: hypothetical protein ACPG4Y_05550 [Chitinophagales bacterium]
MESLKDTLLRVKELEKICGQEHLTLKTNVLIEELNNLYKNSLSNFQRQKIVTDSRNSEENSKAFSQVYAQTSVIIEGIDSCFMLLIKKNTKELELKFGKNFIERFASNNESSTIHKNILKELKCKEQKLIESYFQKIRNKNKTKNSFSNEPYFVTNNLFQGQGNSENVDLKQIYVDLISVRNKIANLKNYNNFFIKEISGQKHNRVDLDLFLKKSSKSLNYFTSRLKKIQLSTLKLDAINTNLKFTFFKNNEVNNVFFKEENYLKVFSKVNQELFEMYNDMKSISCINLEQGKSKKNIAYTTFLYDIKSPYVFMIYESKFSNLRTLTHEIGHAYEKYLNKDLKYFFDFNNKIEIAEAQAISMELFFAYEQNNLFNTKKSKEYLLYILLKNILLINDALILFEFEKNVYNLKVLDVNILDDMWLKINEKYGVEKENAENWALKTHLFNAPCYYINYAISKMIAFQFYENYCKNPEQTFSVYKEFIYNGGNSSKENLYSDFNLFKPHSAEANLTLNALIVKTLEWYSNLNSMDI